MCYVCERADNFHRAYMNHVIHAGHALERVEEDVTLVRLATNQQAWEAEEAMSRGVYPVMIFVDETSWGTVATNGEAFARVVESMRGAGLVDAIRSARLERREERSRPEPADPEPLTYLDPADDPRLQGAMPVDTSHLDDPDTVGLPSEGMSEPFSWSPNIQGAAGWRSADGKLAIWGSSGHIVYSPEELDLDAPYV